MIGGGLKSRSGASFRACATLRSAGVSDSEPVGMDPTADAGLHHKEHYLSSLAETTTTSPLSPIDVVPTTTFSPCRKPTGDRKPMFWY